MDAFMIDVHKGFVRKVLLLLLLCLSITTLAVTITTISVNSLEEQCKDKDESDK